MILKIKIMHDVVSIGLVYHRVYTATTLSCSLTVIPTYSIVSRVKCRYLFGGDARDVSSKYS